MPFEQESVRARGQRPAAVTGIALLHWLQPHAVVVAAWLQFCPFSPFVFFSPTIQKYASWVVFIGFLSVSAVVAKTPAIHQMFGDHFYFFVTVNKNKQLWKMNKSTSEREMVTVH